jgi:hypothetical protein
MITKVETAYTTDLDILRGELGLLNRDIIMAQLNAFWVLWRTAWQQWTMQMSSGISDQSRQLGSINDADNELVAAQAEQRERIKSKLQYQPTDQACRFDTAALYMAPDRATADALTSGFEWDFVSQGNNETPAGNNGELSPGQYGAAVVQNSRWNIYVNNFCNYQAENCNSGCSPAAGAAGGACNGNMLPNADQDVLAGQTLFSNYTLNLFQQPSMTPQVAMEAMNSLIFNVTGYMVPDPIVTGAQGTSPGIDQLFIRREYMAQMSAVGSLLYSIVADRAPGQAAPDVQLMRESMGVQGLNPTESPYASPTPSVREIRQSIIEQLWDPNYYKNLYDNPSTIAQKELYLKAYGLVMLYDMISKQEKISNAYAIETAVILNTSQHDRTNFSSNTPLQ